MHSKSEPYPMLCDIDMQEKKEGSPATIIVVGLVLTTLLISITLLVFLAVLIYFVLAYCPPFEISQSMSEKKTHQSHAQ